MNAGIKHSSPFVRAIRRWKLSHSPISSTRRSNGTVLAIIDRLQLADFAINKPHSHGGGLDVEHVPVLIRDQNGHWHGRFHAVNVIGLSDESANAMRVFTEVVSNTRAIVAFRNKPGSLMLYSNTCLSG